MTDFKALSVVRSLLAGVGFAIFMGIFTQIGTGDAWARKDYLFLMGALFAVGIWFATNLAFEGGVIRRHLIRNGYARKK